jgi:hypothetical protein
MEKELLSVIKTSQQYHHILLGDHFKFIVTAKFRDFTTSNQNAPADCKLRLKNLIIPSFIAP